MNKEIDITLLLGHPLNREFSRIGEGWEAFVDSVRTHGVVQPLLVRKLAGKHYEIIGGHRRAAAAGEVGLQFLECVVREMSDREVLEILVIENLERENPDPVEEGKLLRALAEEGMEPEALAHRLKRSVEWIVTRQRLLDLGDEVLDAVRLPKDAAGHLGMGTVEVLLAVAAEDRPRAIQLVLHPEWAEEVLGPREAAEVIRAAILEPARKKAAWEKENKGLVKAWRKSLGTYLTKDEKSELMVQPLRFEDVEKCVMKTPADAVISPVQLVDPSISWRWVQLALRHKLPVWVVPDSGDAESVAVVDERLLRMAEEAAAEPLYEMRNGERVMVRQHSGEPLLLTKAQLRRKAQAGGGDDPREDDEKAAGRVATAAALLDGEGDPNYDAEEAPEKVIEQTMESRAWVDLGPVRRLGKWALAGETNPAVTHESAPDGTPPWAVEMAREGHWARLSDMMEWVMGLKG
jgi:ParB/RepB/Spo0J family partition protein